MTPRDPYRILQVARHAEPEVIEAAYRRLARKYHPDVSPDPAAKQRMQEINWAYEILKSPEKRARYDRSSAPRPSASESRPKPPPSAARPPPTSPPPPRRPRSHAPEADRQPHSEGEPQARQPKPRPQKPTPVPRLLLGALAGVGLLLLLRSFTQDPTQTSPTSVPPTNTVIVPSPAAGFCGDQMARDYLESIALPVTAIDTVVRNVADKPRDEWDSQFIRTQIGLLDRSSQQLISTGPITCDALINHHTSLLDLIIALDGYLQAQLDGNPVAADVMIEEVMTAIDKASQSLQAVAVIAQATPPAASTAFLGAEVLRPADDLRDALAELPGSACVDEAPGQYRCNFPLEGTTGDVMIVSTSAHGSSDFTTLYLDLEKEVQFGEVERFYALVIQYTVVDASTTSALSNWLANGLISSLWEWDSTGTEVVAFETILNDVYFKTTATASILTYRACSGPSSFCLSDE